MTMWGKEGGNRFENCTSGQSKPDTGFLEVWALSEWRVDCVSAEGFWLNSYRSAMTQQREDGTLLGCLLL